MNCIADQSFVLLITKQACLPFRFNSLMWSLVWITCGVIENSAIGMGV